MPRKPQLKTIKHSSPAYPIESRYPDVKLPPPPTIDKYAGPDTLMEKPWREAIVLRPGALDHERYGSRQSDGSVKPFSPRLLTASTNIRPSLNTASWVDRKPTR